MFKKFWNKKTPKSKDHSKRVKAEYKRSLLEAKMKHILQTSWPSQKKRGVSDIGDEEESRAADVIVLHIARREKVRRKGRRGQ